MPHTSTAKVAQFCQRLVDEHANLQLQRQLLRNEIDDFKSEKTALSSYADSNLRLALMLNSELHLKSELGRRLESVLEQALLGMALSDEEKMRLQHEVTNARLVSVENISHKIRLQMQNLHTQQVGAMPSDVMNEAGQGAPSRSLSHIGPQGVDAVDRHTPQTAEDGSGPAAKKSKLETSGPSETPENNLVNDSTLPVAVERRDEEQALATKDSGAETPLQSARGASTAELELETAGSQPLSQPASSAYVDLVEAKDLMAAPSESLSEKS
eukprot:ANDGO_00700.mRNA.1 hypothetical protein